MRYKLRYLLVGRQPYLIDLVSFELTIANLKMYKKSVFIICKMTIYLQCTPWHKRIGDDKKIQSNLSHHHRIIILVSLSASSTDTEKVTTVN